MEPTIPLPPAETGSKELEQAVLVPSSDTPKTPEWSPDYVRQGIFPFLALPRELRDYIYEYAGPCANPISEGSVKMLHRPWTDADKFIGLSLVCRQTYEEYLSQNPRSPAISLGITDVDDYLKTFFPSTRKVEKEMNLLILDRRGLDAQSRVRIEQDDLLIFTMDLLPLTDLTLREPKFKYSFRSEIGDSLAENDLSALTAIVAARRALTLSLASSVQSTSSLSHLDSIIALPTPAPVSAVKITWTVAGGFCNSVNTLIFLFDSKEAAPWMYGDWVYSSNIKTTIMDLDQNLIPKEYLSEAEMQRICFYKSMGLHKMSRIWKVWVGVAGRDNVTLSRPGKLGLGWVWDHEEKRYQIWSLADDDKDGEHQEQHEADGLEDQEDEDEDEEYEEDIDDEIGEESAWLTAQREIYRRSG